jgi:glucan biosynthesis protein C
VFLLGFWLARDDGFWTALVEWRFAALATALLSCGLFIWCDRIVYPGDTVPPHAVILWLRADDALDQWTSIAAIPGFSHRHLRQGDPVLDYLTQGVFPFYIVHQTIIVVCEFWIKPWLLPQPAEAAILIGATVTGCFVTYEVVRRIGWARPLFGLK